jgi:dethiobiotin synthetase
MKPVTIINGINTDVGKTTYSLQLLHNKKSKYLKPIITGFDINKPEDSDIGKALIVLDLEFNSKNVNQCTKYFFKEPTSPNIASKLEGRKINYNHLLQFCYNAIQTAIKNGEEIIIEMAGGVCTPITTSKTMLDLTRDITLKFKGKVKNVLICSNYLGAISHTISACKVFKFDTIVFNTQTQTKFDLDIKHTLEKFLKKHLVPLGGLEPPRA